MLTSLRVPIVRRFAVERVLHRIGAGSFAQRRLDIPTLHWCAEIRGVLDAPDCRRVMLQGRTYYLEAARPTQYAPHAVYTLESGRLYEVSSPRTAHDIDHYFCIVTTNGIIQRLTDGEALEWS